MISLVLTPNAIHPEGCFKINNACYSTVYCGETLIELTITLIEPIRILQVKTPHNKSIQVLKLVMETKNVRSGEWEPFHVLLENHFGDMPTNWLTALNSIEPRAAYLHRIHAIRTAHGNVRARITLDGVPSLFYQLGTILAV